MCYVPVLWKLVARVASGSLPLVDQLEGRKSPERVPQNSAVICRLSFNPVNSTRLAPLWSIVQEDEGTILRPVWSQFKISSGGISSTATVVTTSSRNWALSSSNCSTRLLLLLVVPLRLTNPILCINVLAQSLVRTTCPPYSANRVQLVFKMMPLAAPSTIAVLTAPPDSRMALRYC